MAIVVDDEEEGSGGGSEAGTAPTAGGSGGQPQGASNKYTQSAFTSGRKILQKNMNSGSPNLVKGFEDKANQASQKLGEKSQAYGQNLASQRQQYQIGDDDVQKGVQGDQEQFKRIQSILKGPGEIEQFQYNPNLDIQDINRLQTEAGAMGALKEQARARGNTGYNQGQASLDAYLFGKSPGGRQTQVNQALATRENVNKQAQDTVAAQAQARQQAMDEISQRQAGVRSGLQNQLGSLQTGAQTALQKVIAEQKEKTKAQETGKQFQKTQLQAQAEKEAKRLAQEMAQDKDLQSYYQNIGNYYDDPTAKMVLGENYAKKYGNVDFSRQGGLQESLEKKMIEGLRSGNYNFADYEMNPLKDDAYYDENSAGQFNRINELLGLGGRQDVDDASSYVGNKKVADLSKTLGEDIKKSLIKSGQDAKSKRSKVKDDIQDTIQNRNQSRINEQNAKKGAGKKKKK